MKRILSIFILFDCLVFFNVPKVLAQPAELDVLQKWMQFSDASNELYHLLASDAYPFLKLRAASIRKISALSSWQAKQEQIKQMLSKIIGPFPKKYPLNAKVTHTEDFESYRIENIIFESQPHFFVTSSMFIPKDWGGKKQLPAILYCSGHADNGYRDPVYMHIILNLVKKGFIVYAFDPIGQGERLGYFDTSTKKSIFPWPSNEHSYPGVQSFITGSSLAKYMIWDGIRAIDYLISRKEVDPSNIGVAGRSGGGTQCAYIAAMDGRVKAAAPENFITNFTRLFQSIGPQDAEQNFLDGIANGFDHSDLLLVRAPKPTLMICTSQDMFSIQGAMETASEVKRFYKAYNKEDDFEMVVDNAPHASTKNNREAMYAFFQHYLNNPGRKDDEQTETLDDTVLQVATSGQVATSFKNAESVFSLNKEIAEGLERRLDNERKMPGKYLPLMVSAARNLSGYRKRDIGSVPVLTGRISRRGYSIEKYFVRDSVDRHVIPYLLFIPEKSNHKGMLYLHPRGKSVEAMSGGQIEWFVQNGFTVLAPDMIGTGETGPGKFIGDSYIDSISYNLWFAAVLTGKSILGIQAGDISLLSEILGKAGGIQEVYALAKEQMAPALLHAAAFDKHIKKIALIRPYTSYRSIVMNRFYKPKFVFSTVAAALSAYDLPDLAASLAPRKLLIYGATDGNGHVATDGDPDLSIIKAGYHFKNADSLIQTVSAGDTLRDYLKIWME